VVAAARTSANSESCARTASFGIQGSTWLYGSSVIANAGVSKPLLHDLGMDALEQHQCGRSGNAVILARVMSAKLTRGGRFPGRSTRLS